ncbi:MAG: GTPase Era [Candidatus Nanopelagicales bacterium]
MSEFRSGFACIVGRPNVGKSTLTNQLVGQKISIISKQPQTTRHAIRGIVHSDIGQIVLVDTPGIHKPKTLLGSKLNELVKQTWSEVDVIVFCIPADQKIGPGDKFIAQEIMKYSKKPKIGVLTKIDNVKQNIIAERLVELDKLAKELNFEWQEIIPISSQTGENLEKLRELIIKYLPIGPELYPQEVITDESIETMISEYIREAALEDLREELPHSLAVVVQKIETDEERPADKPLMRIYAEIYVERDSQKGIIIGNKGSKLKEIGSVARKQIEKLVGMKVYLDLQVKVALNWQTDQNQLTKLGF